MGEPKHPPSPTWLILPPSSRNAALHYSFSAIFIRRLLHPLLNVSLGHPEEEALGDVEIVGYVGALQDQIKIQWKCS